MNLLITGGLGSIGLEMVAAASQLNGVRTVTMSRNPVPDDVSLPVNTVHEIGSLLDEKRLMEVLQRYEISHIIHAAGARTSLCESDPLQGFESNVLATSTLMRSAESTGTARKVIFLSSGAVYGGAKGQIDESHPIAPQTNYALTKAAGEICVGGQAELETIIVRPGFVAGPGFKSTLCDFIRAAATGDPLELRFVERFFLHWAPELARDIIRLLQLPDGKCPAVIHLPGRSYSLDDLTGKLSEVAAEFDLQPEISTTIDRSLKLPEDLNHKCFSDLLGEVAPVSLEQICRELIRREAA